MLPPEGKTAVIARPQRGRGNPSLFPRAQISPKEVIRMNTKKLLSLLLVLALAAAALCALSVCAFAADDEAAPESAEAAPAEKTTGTKAIAAAAVVGVAAAVGAGAMAIAISKSTEGMARQPEAAGKINSAMMLGLVFIETTIIYALIVAILIIFVL